MGNNWSKDIFAKNLRMYMKEAGKTQKEMAEIIGVAQSTFNEWATGKKFPRIDKLEMLAHYFGILKSDLIEDKTEVQRNNDIIADIVACLRRDEQFLHLVSRLTKLNSSELEAINQIALAFKQNPSD